MTLPSAVRERLILVASRRRSPTACVLLCLSLPARSTKLSFPTLTVPLPCRQALRFAFECRYVVICVQQHLHVWGIPPGQQCHLPSPQSQ